MPVVAFPGTPGSAGERAGGQASVASAVEMLLGSLGAATTRAGYARTLAR